MYREYFPERIKETRKINGFTQDEVEKETDISRTLLSRYENGKLEPNLETLGMLAEFYNVSVDWLLGIGSRSNKINYNKVN